MSNQEHLIKKKTANALIDDVAAKKGILISLSILDGSLDLVTGKPTDYSLGHPSIKKMLEDKEKEQGGLWVGGNLELHDKYLVFTANKLNKVLHVSTQSVTIPLDSVTQVSVRKAFLTKIIDIMWSQNNEQYISSFRCFGANKFAELIRKTAQKYII